MPALLTCDPDGFDVEVEDAAEDVFEEVEEEEGVRVGVMVIVVTVGLEDVVEAEDEEDEVSEA